MGLSAQRDILWYIRIPFDICIEFTNINLVLFAVDKKICHFFLQKIKQKSNESVIGVNAVLYE